MKRSHLVPVVLLSKSVVGASTVAFPRYFAVLGWPLALAMLLALSAATVASTEVVLRAMQESRSGSYAGAVKATLEGKGERESGENGGGGEGAGGGGGGGRSGRGRSGGGGGSLLLSLRRSLPSLALEASGTAFSFGLLCVYNIVVADLAVGGRRGASGAAGGAGGGGGGGLLCPLPAEGGGGKAPPPSSPSPFSFLFCSRPRFSVLLNAVVLIPLSLRPAARDSKIPSALGISALLAWAAATLALCLCAWLSGTLGAPSAVPDWREIAAGSGGEAAAAAGAAAGAAAIAAGALPAPQQPPPLPLPPPPPGPLPPIPPPSPPPPPPPPPSLLACLVGLARAAGLPTSGLVCQLTAPFIVGEVNRGSPRDAALVVREAGALSAAVYALLSVGAGALFGSGRIEANVLSNWQPEALAAAVPRLFGGSGGRGGRGRGGPAAARLLSGLVRGAVAVSLVTMYPLLMFPCRDGALRLWGRLLLLWKGRRRREEDAADSAESGAEQRLLSSEEQGREEEQGAERAAATTTTTTTTAAAAAAAAASSSSFSHAASTLLLASCAAVAALSSGDSAFDVLRLTGATAGAAVSFLIPAAMARAQGKAALAAALAAVGAVMIGTAFA